MTRLLRFLTVCISRPLVWPLLVSLSIVWAASQLAADDPDNLRQQIIDVVSRHKGDVSVLIRHRNSGFELSYNADRPMPAASLIKVAIMAEAYRQAHLGRLELSQQIRLTEADKVPGSGILTRHFSDGTLLSLRDYIRLMIAHSDNTATNIVLDTVGIAAPTKAMQDLGFANTRLYSKVYRRSSSLDAERSRRFGLGSTTARETVRLLEMLNAECLVSSAASAEMKKHLLACEDRSMIAKLLPSGVRFAHKTGATSAVRCDAGILSTDNCDVVLCILTANNGDKRWNNQNAAEVLCAKIGALVYRHFQPDGTSGAMPQQLQTGAFGPDVETLQRTLNARLSPSPQLAVDGDFGPATEAAVRRFQAVHGFTENGIVTSEVLRALSPLMTTDAPVPPPEIVNLQKLPRIAETPLDEPPIVTCRAWVIADADTGTPIYQHHADQRLAGASTTKIMTALLVLQHAGQHPDVLDEVVSFSRRADRTRGSSCGLREGEQTTVRELIYGLLLPSGNDAAIALAEHLGHRISQAEDFTAEDLAGTSARSEDPVDAFVHAMNRQAHRLNMEDTVYRNPHGLDEPGHLTTARDLARLAAHAIRLPRFCRYVDTRQHGCTVTAPAGYTRNLLWKNTNQLLQYEQYHGIKTGTTSRAKACLVSWNQRPQHNLIVVVLGADSSASRYVDTRNLFRFAWRQDAALGPRVDTDDCSATDCPQSN